MAATARVLEEAAVVIEEVRSQLRRQPDCSEKRTSLEACFDALNASLTDVPLEELGIEKRVSSTILDAVEEFELATGRASRIVSKISKHPFLLTGKPRPSPDEDSTSAEILHRELIARIEQECRATQAAMDSDVEEMRQERLQIEGELKKQTAELTAAHRRNLCSAQESFNLAMQQIQGTKDHGLCLLRLKSLESRGNQTIQRLEAEIKAARREIAKARKLVSTQDKETLLSSYRTRATALRLRKQDERNAPGNRRGESVPFKSTDSFGSAVPAVDSKGEARSDVTPKRPRRELFREEDEERSRSEDSNLLRTLEGEQLEAYLQSLKALVNKHRSRGPEGCLVPSGPVQLP